MAVRNQLIPHRLPEKLDAEKYRRLLSYPGWNYFTQSIKATRAFENGLDACLVLLRYTEDIREGLSVKEYERNLQTLYTFLLIVLDHLDRWDDYLSLWENLRKNTNFSATYAKEGLQLHGNRIQPFILGEDGEYILVHFLYGMSDRKELIKRKQALQRSGKKARKHTRQEELSNKQIEQRLQKVKDRLAWASKFNR